jgi:hypothetical protein
VQTTWRDVIDAATTVGRDPAPWFAEMPALAWCEFAARRSPLMAYLRRSPDAKPKVGTSGYIVEPNIVYSHGTERTARGAFGYRIGMTMAEWACRLMGLGPTSHAEADPPPEAGPAWWSPTVGLPDLVGDHWRAPATWLVEAKAGRRIGLTVLAKGAKQLAVADLMTGPHVRVLCGTSLEHRLFVTIDAEIATAPAEYGSSSPGIGSPETDDAALLALARSRMLTYYALTALPSSARSVRPVGMAVADQATRQQNPRLVYPLEQDTSTREERLLARDPDAYSSQRPTSARLDMLTGPVPGTDMVIGMSRRLFAACRNLAADEAEIAADLRRSGHAYLPGPLYQMAPDQAALFDLTDDEVDERARERRMAFAEREAEVRPRLRTAAREGFERGRDSSWQQLIDDQPALNAELQPGLLEAATPDTYLAINVETASL